MKQRTQTHVMCIYIGGPWDGRQGQLDVDKHSMTIGAMVGHAYRLGRYVCPMSFGYPSRDDLGRRRMEWKGWEK